MGRASVGKWLRRAAQLNGGTPNRREALALRAIHRAERRLERFTAAIRPFYEPRLRAFMGLGSGPFGIGGEFYQPWLEMLPER